MCMIKKLHKPLLGKSVIRGLNLLRRFGAVKQKQSILEQFSSVFKGHRKFEGECTIKLQDNAKLFAVTNPGRVSITLVEPVRKELNLMERMGVISPFQEPTNWCTGMVPVLKKNGQVHICVDLMLHD